MSKSGKSQPKFLEKLENKEFLVPRDVSFASLPNGVQDLDYIANALRILAQDATKRNLSDSAQKKMLQTLQFKTEQL